MKNGSEVPPRVVPTLLPHADFGDPECCGCLHGIINGDLAHIECNECGQVLRRVRAAYLEKTFAEMESSLDVDSAVCPYCGTENSFPGFSRVQAFICQHCGRPCSKP